MDVPQLQGASEALYIKCLFKTISFPEVQAQLVQRGLESASDSYYIKTLRLRLHILKTEDCYKELQIDLETELAVIEKKSDKGYICSLSGCSYSSPSYRKLMNHLKTIHTLTNQPLICQLNGCSRVLSSVKMLCLHVKTSHQPTKSSVSLRQNQLAEQLSTLKCMMTSCSHQQVKTVKELKSHLMKVHTDRYEQVQCIFHECNFKADRSGTLSSHFCKKHPIQQFHNLKSNIVENVEDTEDVDASSVEVVQETMLENADDWSDNADDFEETLANDLPSDSTENEDDNLGLFTRALAIQFNSWMNVQNIAYTTVNLIVSEVFNSFQKGVDVTRRKVRGILINEGLAADVIEKVLEKIDVEDPFAVARKQLERETDRIKYIMKEFSHAAPITVRLNTEDLREKPETMQYIPIKKTLKILLEDDTYINQKLSDAYFHEENVIKDCRDGLIFRENEFFKTNPTAIPLLLFTDELEVANPLGAGKTKHKVQCTYYTTLDVIPQLRSRVKSIQLCSLVLSRHWKKYGNLKCNRNFIEDLKDLETNGLEVKKPSKKVLKIGLGLVVGDNLGQHMLCEMNCCFSSGFICRFCNGKYSDICKDHLLYSEIDEDYSTELLTKAKYDECADLAVANGTSSEETLGIKSHCVLNVLQSFHCVGQTPPCLGHDYFEGIFSYDVQHYLDFIINKEKLISVDDFNKKIKNVKLSARDAKNRPKNFKKGAKKYEGNAGSLRVLSRILTLILSSVLEESCTEKFLIKLHEVGEIITAPVLTVTEIEVVMTQIISEYLNLRIEAIETLGMPNPRPKHHYLSHYPSSFKNVGPLISVWGMRMESKHVFLKGVIRAAKNFKNVPLTCATRHQLGQVSYRYFGLFNNNKFEIPDTSPDALEVSAITNDPFMKNYLTALNPKSLIPKYLKIYGTRYEAGKVLILNKMNHGHLKVGLIRSISFLENKVNFLVRTFEANQSKFGFYVTTKSLSEDESVVFENLGDYYPVEMVGTIRSFSFVLHHFVSDKSA